MQKNAKYRRSIWFFENNETLQDLMVHSLKIKPTVEQSKFIYASGATVQISQRRIDDDGFTMCYFTLFAEGKRAGTVENGGAGINRVGAPKGQEFLKTGIHMAILGDHVAFIANGMTNDGQLTGLLSGFMQHANIPLDRLRFGLMPRADRDQIGKLLAKGAKSLDLGLSDFVTAIDDQNEKQQSPIRKKVNTAKQSLAAIFVDDMTPTQIEAASKLEASIHIGFDGRGADPLIAQVLADVADNIASDEASQFKIITQDGDVITQDKLVVSRPVIVEGDDVALDHISAFSELKRVMKDWNAAGITER